MNKEVRIVILQRGWVYVGFYRREGDRCYLTNAQNIRRWGTQKGLGQLIDGPLRETALDPSGTGEYHQLTEVASIVANAEKWNGALG